MNMRHINTNQYSNKNQMRGAAVVELALLLVILLMIVSGVIEFGRTFWYYDALTKATRDGARFLSYAKAASAPPALNTNLQNQAKAMVVNAANFAQVPNFSEGNVTVSCYPSCTAPNNVTVQINAYRVTIGGWIPVFTPTGSTSWTVTISPSTTMRYMK